MYVQVLIESSSESRVLKSSLNEALLLEEWESFQTDVFQMMKATMKTKVKEAFTLIRVLLKGQMGMNIPNCSRAVRGIGNFLKRVKV